MSLTTYAPTQPKTDSDAQTKTHTAPTKPGTVRFQGDVPPSIQRQLVEFSDFHLKDVAFARTTGARLVLWEAAVFRRAEDARLQARVVYEVTVAEDMTNRQHTLHGGCAAFLLDTRSSVGLAFLAMVRGKPADVVSQTIAATYHAPAPL